MTTEFEQYQQAKQRRESLNRRMAEIFKTAFLSCTKNLFEKYPSLQSFAWAQYTPYFNDGEECIFSANLHDVDINEIDPYEDGYDKVLGEIITSFLCSFEELDYKEVFGDHCKVTVTREGITIEEYDHD